MKKTLLFLLFIVMGLLISSSSNAVTQNQIDSTVQIVCPDNYGNWFSGSGTMIDSKGIILTNKHVVTDEYGGIINTCYIGFIESISEEPNFGTETNPNLAEVKYYTTSDDMDAAILYLDNPTNKSYPYINIWNSNSDNLQFGEEIEVMGFPGVGGSTVTYSSGDFSGFGSSSYGTQNYIKTTAPLEHGNSGGSSYNATEQFIGIPTMVVPGELNSISYILSVNSIKNWLSNKLTSNYKQEIITQTPQIISPSKSIQEDITPPNIENLNIGWSRYLYWNGEKIWSVNGIGILKNYAVEKYNKINFSVTGAEDNGSGIDGYYYYIGKDINANPVVSGKFKLNDDSGKNNKWLSNNKMNEIVELEDYGIYYFKVAVKDNAGNISKPYTAVYVYENEDYTKIQNIKFFKDKNYSVPLGKYDYHFFHDEPYLGDGLWGRINEDFDDTLSCKTRLKNLYISWEYPKNLSEKGSVAAMANKLTLNELKEGEFTKNNKFSILNLDKGKRLTGFRYTDHFGQCYDYPREIYYSSGLALGPQNQKYYNIYIKPFLNNNSLFNNHEILSLVYDPYLDKDITCIGSKDINDCVLKDKKLVNDVWDTIDYYVEDAGYNSLKKLESNKKNNNSNDSISSNLSSRLKGKLLLQVNQGGRIWYVNPDNAKRFEITFANALPLFENFALGITDDDLNQIPLNTDNWTSATGNRLKGKLLLQVEQSGRIWYVDFDGKRWEVTWANLMALFESLALGITDDDLNQIDTGEL